MALTKDDLQAIDSIVAKHTTEGTDDLARIVNDGFQGSQNLIQETQDLMTVEFRKVNNRLDALDVWRADFRDLVRMLAAKKVLTVEEAGILHVHLDHPVA